LAEIFSLQVARIIAKNISRRKRKEKSRILEKKRWVIF
jgi:hypothetical protein